MTRLLLKASAAFAASLAFVLCLSATARAQSNEAYETEVERVRKEKNLKPARINTFPLEDVAQRGKEQYEQGKLSPDATFDVTVTAALRDDGSFDADTFKLQGSASEESLMLLVKDFVLAVSESKLFAVLDGVKEVSMALKLDRQALTMRAAAAVASEARASEMATGYNLLLAAVRKKKEGTDEGVLWQSFKISAEGKQFVMAFEMPREAAVKMIADKLAKKAAAGAGRQ